METAGDPRLDHHLMKRNQHWKTTYIPMAFSGDAVPVIKVVKAGTKSIDATSISPLMAIGQTKIIKQFVFGLFEKCKVATNYSQSMDCLQRCELKSTNNINLYRGTNFFTEALNATNCKGNHFLLKAPVENMSIQP